MMIMNLNEGIWRIVNFKHIAIKLISTSAILRYNGTFNTSKSYLDRLLNKALILLSISESFFSNSDRRPDNFSSIRQ